MERIFGSEKGLSNTKSALSKAANQTVNYQQQQPFDHTWNTLTSNINEPSGNEEDIY